MMQKFLHKSQDLNLCHFKSFRIYLSVKRKFCVLFFKDGIKFLLLDNNYKTWANMQEKMLENAL